MGRLEVIVGSEEGVLNKRIQGYIRSDVPLRILDTALHKSSSDPSMGVLEISTEDGVLRLAMSRDAVQDLQIDLSQFIVLIYCLTEIIRVAFGCRRAAHCFAECRC